MPRLGKILILLWVWAAVGISAAASEIASREVCLNLDCRWCDLEFLQEELDWLCFVRDRQSANLFVQANRQRTAGGGNLVRLYFQGQKEFAGRNDTLAFSTTPDASEDTIRRQMLQTLTLGLVPYLARTEAATALQIRYSRPAKNRVFSEEKDPWNGWVFRFSLNSWFSGQKSSRFLNAWSAAGASRITEEVQQKLYYHASYQKNRYEYQDYVTNSVQSNQGGGGNYIAALDQHWSWGGWIYFYSNTYENIDFSLSAAFGFEYSVFPYSQANRRALVLQYIIRPSVRRYGEETIFLKTEEALLELVLRTKLELQHLQAVLVLVKD
jgi:hypothetical protein